MCFFSRFIYIYIWGGCAQEAQSHRALEPCVIGALRHFDGCRFENNFDYLLWSAFAGVDPDNLDLHSGSTDVGTVKEDEPDNVKRDERVTGKKKEDEADEKKEDEKEEKMEDAAEDETERVDMLQYRPKDIKIYHQMLHDLREYIANHEESGTRPPEPQLPSKRQRALQPTSDDTKSKPFTKKANAKNSTTEWIEAIRQWQQEGEQAGMCRKVPRCTCKESHEQSLGRWVENLHTSKRWMEPEIRTELIKLRGFTERLQKWDGR
jgi:hypothetical protein